MSIAKLIRNTLKRAPAQPIEHKSTHWNTPWYAIGSVSASGAIPGREGTSGYNNNSIVHACVRLIAASAAAQDWKGFDGEHMLTGDHPVMRVLRQPSPRLSGSALMEAAYCHLMLHGEAFLLRTIAGNRLHSIHVLRPDRVNIETDRDGWPNAYTYRTNNLKARYPISDDFHSDVLHVCMFNPADDHRGTSPLNVAAPAVEMHNAATDWNRNLLQNSARPSGAMVYRDGNNNTMTTEQFERLKRELAEVYQGAANAGRPMLLEGGLNWEQMSLSPRDLDFVQIKNMAAREIALAFGVPPMMLGIPGDNTYSNYAEANRMLWRQTLLPLIYRTASDLTQWLSPFAAEDKFRIGISLDAIEALSAERERRWNRISNATFLSDNEKRAALGLEASDNIASNTHNRPANQPS